MKTVIPRIKKSISERGLLASMRRSILLPIHLVQEYRVVRRLAPTKADSDFDRDHNVDTEGDFDGWTYLSDLEIPSPNWISGNHYAPIEPERFQAILSGLDLKWEDFLFVDFGSGKGRALLLASHFPFKSVLGLEFSPELHAIAQRNILKYRHAGQQCGSVESLCVDFIDFQLPPAPSLLFLFDPCDQSALTKVLANIGSSFQACPRPIYLMYVAPTESKERLLDSMPFLVKLARDTEENFCLYKCS